VCQRQNPSVFGGSDAYMTKGQWQLTTSFFHYYSDKHYIGTEPNTRINAYDGPVNVRSQFNFNLAYAITDRWNVSLDVPFQHQSYDLHRVIPESGSTEPVPIHAGADGLGDMTLRGGYWLFSPRHSRGNVFVSLGLEMPTGKSDATADVYGYQIPVDVSVQPGNGAWGVVPAVQAFRTFHRFSLYGFATYLIDPRNTTGTPAFFPSLFRPGATTVNSSSDQYVAKIGGAVPTPLHWLSLTAGYRFSGVPVNDLFGPSDGFRRPANLQYAEPGVEISLLGRTIDFSVPIVTHINVKPRIIGGVNRNTDSTVPSFMFSISYPLRFGRGRGRSQRD
jgi:hypothetical protein